MVLFAICTIKAIQKAKKTQARGTKSLTVLLFSLTITCLCSAADALFFETVYFFPYGYVVALMTTGTTMTTFVFLSIDVFLAREKTEHSKQMTLIRSGIAIIEIGLCLWAALSRVIEANTSTSLPLILIFGISLMMYMIIASKSYGLAKRVEDKAYRRPITYIFYYTITNLVMFLLFIIESFEVGKEGATIWGFLGACLLSVTAILAYVGFLKPVKKE